MVQVGDHGVPFGVDNDGNFVVGLSRDAPASLVVRCTPQGSAPLSKTIAITPRHYLSVTISGTNRSGADPESGAAPNAEFGAFRGDDLFDGGDPDLPQDSSERASIVASTPQERETRAQRLQREAAAKQQAFRSMSPVEGYLQDFQWPVHGRVTSQWGAQRVIITKDGDQRPSRPHGGVDIRALPGTPILAPALGVVVLADPDYFFEGGVVFLDHGQNLVSAYLHQSAVSVQVGQTLQQGQQIGLVGQSGRATGPHLCWRMKWRGTDVDPSSLLAPT
jgi:murein DD-endopeptidase MepM/ murein hydrolase activator NlpD